MSMKNLTESMGRLSPIDVFVPLFRDDEKDIGIHVKLFERFGRHCILYVNTLTKGRAWTARRSRT